MTISKWNARYGAGDLGPTEPSALLAETAASLPPGRALDLACGVGRNAVYLAKLGWTVVAVDGSSEALRILSQRDARIETHRIDLEQGSLPFPDASFDLVCIIHFLHRSLFAEARRVVRPGGLVLASIETTRSKMNRAYVVDPGELRTLFADWELVIDRETEIAQIAARKPR